MRQFYEITQKIHDLLIADPNCNVVTIGDITEADMKKLTTFPAAHLIPSNMVFNGSTISFTISVLVMDIADFSKVQLKDVAEPFYGTTDLQDIWNTQAAVLNRLIENLRRAQDVDFELDGNPVAEPFKDRFENLLAGWFVDLTIIAPNNELSLC